MENPRISAVPPVPPVPPVRQVPPVFQFGGNTAEIPSDQHLADAVLHLKRCLLAIKAAAESNPALLTRLGTPYAVLAEQLRELEQQAPCGGA